MAKGYLILDSSSIVVSTHKWGGDRMEDRPCPIVPQTGGSVIAMTEAGVDDVVSLMIGGQPVSVLNGGEVWVNGEKIGSIVDGEVVLD